MSSTNANTSFASDVYPPLPEPIEHDNTTYVPWRTPITDREGQALIDLGFKHLDGPAEPTFKRVQGYTVVYITINGSKVSGKSPVMVKTCYRGSDISHTFKMDESFARLLLRGASNSDLMANDGFIMPSLC